MGRTGLEEGLRASLEVQPWVKEHGRSKRRGEHKETCYEFDGTVQAVGQVKVKKMGPTWKTNTHKKMKNTTKNNRKTKYNKWAQI